MMSPSSKLRSVGLLPAVWGKMVLTRGFLAMLRPDELDVERDRVPSPRLPWSANSRGWKNTLETDLDGVFLLLFSAFQCHTNADSRPHTFWIVGCSYLSCDPAMWLVVWAHGWTCWLVDWSVLWAAGLEEAPGAANSSEERTRHRMSAHKDEEVQKFCSNSTRPWPFVMSHRASTVVKAAKTSASCWDHLKVNVEDPIMIFEWFCRRL